MIASKIQIFYIIFALLSLNLAQAVSFTSAVAAYNVDAMSGGNLVDITGKNHTSSGLGGATVVAGPYGNALSFDGTDQVVIADAPDLRLGTQITLEAHFMVTSYAGDWVRIVGKGLQGPRNYGLWYNGIYPYFLFQMYGASGNIGALIQVAPELNRWYHMAGTYNGSVARLYIDGVEVANQVVSMTPYTSSDPLTIGGADFHAKHIGLIDNVAVFNTALSATDIAAHATGNIGVAVPEPHTALCLLLALGSLSYFRKRGLGSF